MKLKYILLIATFAGFSKTYAGDIYASAKPLKSLTAPTMPGPGTLLGFDLAYYRNNYHDHNAGKTNNPGPSSYFGITPNAQFRLAKGWSASIGVGVNMYNYKYDNSPYHSTEKETYFGPSLGLYHYCDDPCDDDLYPFVGFNAYYYTGPRTETNWQDVGPDLTHHVENGKITESGLGFTTGAYYNLGHHFGVKGSVYLFDYIMDKTVYEKTNPDYYRSTSHFAFFNWGSAGFYYNLPSKGN